MFCGPARAAYRLRGPWAFALSQRAWVQWHQCISFIFCIQPEYSYQLSPSVCVCVCVSIYVKKLFEHTCTLVYKLVSSTKWTWNVVSSAETWYRNFVREKSLRVTWRSLMVKYDLWARVSVCYISFISLGLLHMWRESTLLSISLLSYIFCLKTCV